MTPPTSLKVHRDDIEHLPPLYRAFANYLVERGDPCITIVNRSSKQPPEAVRSQRISEGSHDAAVLG